MSGFAILDLVIGLIFIYFLLSIMCSAIYELIANFISLRAWALARWVEQTFWEQNSDKKNKKMSSALGKRIMDHGLIKSLTQSQRKPSYIPSGELVRALFDIIVTDHRKDTNAQPYTLADLKAAFQSTTLVPADMKRVFVQYLEEANGSIDAARQRFESWYDESMKRVSGWYKKWAQRIIIVISVIVCYSINIDSIAISQYLYSHPEARTKLADAAAQVAKDTAVAKDMAHLNTILHPEKDTSKTAPVPADTSKKTAVSPAPHGPALTHADSLQLGAIAKHFATIDSVMTQMNNYDLPIGWTDDQRPKGWQLLLKIVGIFITAMAISFGAPFWFDMLNKLVNIRGAGPAPNGKAKPKKGTTV